MSSSSDMAVASGPIQLVQALYQRLAGVEMFSRKAGR